MKILLLSAYTAASHQYWIDGLVDNFPDHDWTVLCLPPRYFSWRIRGNSLTWAFSEQEKLNKNYDLLIATSMVDLSALRGMVPHLTTLPTIVYFHENQFAYPESNNSESARPAVEPQLVNLYTALCADQVVFNSAYNRNSFLSGVEKLLKKLPDEVPAGIGSVLRKKSSVVPVPLDENLFDFEFGSKAEIFNLVWNHRWEFDKGPERLLACLQQLPPRLKMTVHVVGQSFRQAPAVFNDIKILLTERGCLGQWGFVESRERYLKLLSIADAVLSTSLHDFQGLSVLEAYILRCMPIVPDRLAYPEFIPSDYFYNSNLPDLAQEAKAAADKIVWAAQQKALKKPLLAPKVNLSWRQQRTAYQRLFLSLEKA